MDFDPKQIIEIRQLIKTLGEDHTVILSSHILTEVRSVCNEIIIISKGKIVVNDTPENLEKLFSTAATQSEDSIYMTQIDEDEIIGLRWTYQDESYDLSKNDDTWVNPDDTNFQINQTNVAYMVSSVASISAGSKISDVTDLSQYRLEPPKTISLTLSEDRILDIMLGDYNQVSGGYYAMTSESNDVFLISDDFTYYFEYSISDLEYTEDIDSSEEEASE